MICEKDICTGCFGCFNICPKNAIEMYKDEYGNIFPRIIKEKCINCELCKKICPQLKRELELKESIRAYAMYNKNPKKRHESTSGGAATTFYEYILDNKGIIYGASNLFGLNEFKFIRIDNKNDLYKVKGSKYVHCYINGIMKQVKKDLLSDKTVLFIGTPCQVSGLKSFLMKNYDNLITIDIICHGVPSQKLLFDEINIQGIDYRNVHYVSVRDDKMFNFKLLDGNRKILLEKKFYDIYYYQNFLRGNIYRENCYNCRYARRERISDVTIGDFWGLDKNSKVYDDEAKGISVLLPNTKKGLELIKNIENECVIEERTVDEAYKTNGQLNKPMIKSASYYKYIKYYPLVGYIKTMKKIMPLKSKIKKMIRKIIHK